MKFVENGVCAPQGFQASGIHVGVKTHAAWKKDVALIVSDVECAAAGIFTKNVVKAAPILVDLAHLADGKARAILANSGNANACAPQGEENAARMCAAAAKAIGCDAGDVLVSSTGVIGQTLNISVIEEGVPALYAALESSAAASDAAAHAIMTTDTVKKEAAVETVIGGKTCRIGGIAKGSGMIAPNMATMLCFLTTDAAVTPTLLHEALLDAVGDTFNMLTVDGDTSTNDTVALLANGAAENPLISSKGEDYDAFCGALRMLCAAIVRALAADGEGATRLLEVRLRGGASRHDARMAARAVAGSSLLKAAIFGADANWGRVLCAIGYSGAQVDVSGVDVAFVSKAGQIEVCKNGAGIPFDEDTAKTVLTQPEVTVDIRLRDGEAAATAWGCDLTYDYVKINGDYRS